MFEPAVAERQHTRIKSELGIEDALPVARFRHAESRRKIPSLPSETGSPPDKLPAGSRLFSK
jgi:hypothetical protein